MCDKYGVTCHSFRSYAPNAYVPESYDYHCFSDTAGKTKWPGVCTYFMATNVCYMEAINDKSHPADFHFLTTANQLMKDDNGTVMGVIATQYDKDGKETGKLCVKTSKGLLWQQAVSTAIRKWWITIATLTRTAIWNANAPP